MFQNFTTLFHSNDYFLSNGEGWYWNIIALAPADRIEVTGLIDWRTSRIVPIVIAFTPAVWQWNHENRPEEHECRMVQLDWALALSMKY
jgi:hypothetical protein